MFGLNTQLLGMLDCGRNTTSIPKAKLILDLSEDLRDSLEAPSRWTPDSHEVKKMRNGLEADLIFCFNLMVFSLCLMDLGLLVSGPAVSQQWGFQGAIQCPFCSLFTRALSCLVLKEPLSHRRERLEMQITARTCAVGTLDLGILHPAVSS